MRFNYELGRSGEADAGRAKCAALLHHKSSYRALVRLDLRDGGFRLVVFFFGDSRSLTSPLAISIMSLAGWAESRGRLR
jgi:hypothetical protein